MPLLRLSNSDYNSWVLLVNTDEGDIKYYACASVRRHLEGSLLAPVGPIEVKGTLKVIESTDTMCKAVFMLDEDDTALVPHMIDYVTGCNVSEFSF